MTWTGAVVPLSFVVGLLLLLGYLAWMARLRVKINMQGLIRQTLALGFLALAAWLMYSFVTMPYEVTQVCAAQIKPDGSGLFFGFLISSGAGVACAFMPDWS